MLELSRNNVENVCGGVGPIVDKSDVFYKVGHAIGEGIKFIGAVGGLFAAGVAAAAGLES
ncbi:hypothetical protein [Oleiagrimonas sp.]|jgi:hypothetical protein|uniref:hypothetical protein n=1 Tax=Oleiagrimonas sp. TaxID=2010330 RepID=UPI002635977D|nr:hypothetical protein [Oleiagrimonas sp.]MDA3913989.1 hypothetical protein [Oleiagrimonas sp.]